MITILSKFMSSDKCHMLYKDIEFRPYSIKRLSLVLSHIHGDDLMERKLMNRKLTAFLLILLRDFLVEVFHIHRYNRVSMLRIV